MKKTYRGSCHCGAIRFEADIDLSAGTIRCNCRFCTKARFWFAIVPNADFRLLADATLTDYQRTPPSKSEPFLHFTFCRVCGVRGFTRSGGPAADGFHAVNLGCLDDATDAELAAAPVRYPDGRNDDWPHDAASTYL